MPSKFNSPEGNLENYFVTEYELIDQWVGDRLWAAGDTTNGFEGFNPSTSTPVQVFGRGNNWRDRRLKLDGTLWVWGDNASGEFGNGTTISSQTPVPGAGGLSEWKNVEIREGNVGIYRVGIKKDGSLWTWGNNNIGQLGIGTIGGPDRLTPVTTTIGGNDWKIADCPTEAVIAIKIDGSLWSWGQNNFGKLGLGDTETRVTPTQIGNSYDWKNLTCGSSHTVALKTDGTLWSWGYNTSGQLGIGDTTNRFTPVPVFGNATNWKTLEVDGRGGNSAAIKSDGTLWVWGNNSGGSLGINTIGTNVNRLTPVTTFAGGTNWKTASLSANQGSGVKTDGTLWVWGDNGIGQLGTGDYLSRLTPVTTFMGGANWKSSTISAGGVIAVTNGTNPALYLS
jgi:alpha-tubulin suppressor-like RCC1 family protein